MNPENTQQVINEHTNSTPAATVPGGGFSRKTLFLIVFLALITVGLVALALMPKANTPDNLQTQIQTVTPQTTLAISTMPQISSSPSAYKLNVDINTGENKVNTVQLELSYDPNVLTNVDINPAGFFENPNILIKKIDQANGRISYALGITSGQSGISGQGVLATISFSSSQKGKVNTEISFTPKTEVKADGTPESVLKSSVGALFSLETVLATPSSSLQKIGTSSAR